jgi:hypothetical protein
MKKFLLVVGAVLILFGAVTLIHPELKMPAKRREVDVAGQKLIVNTQRIVTVPPVLGGLVILAGAIVVFIGARKTTRSAGLK